MPLTAPFLIDIPRTVPIRLGCVKCMTESPERGPSESFSDFVRISDGLRASCERPAPSPMRSSGGGTVRSPACAGGGPDRGPSVEAAPLAGQLRALTGGRYQLRPAP